MFDPTFPQSLRNTADLIQYLLAILVGTATGSSSLS